MQIPDRITIELPEGVWVAGRRGILWRLYFFTGMFGPLLLIPSIMALASFGLTAPGIGLSLVAGLIFLGPMWIYNWKVVDPRAGYSIYYTKGGAANSSPDEALRSALEALGAPKTRIEPTRGGAGWKVGQWTTVRWEREAMARSGHGTVGTFPARITILTGRRDELNLHRSLKGWVIVALSGERGSPTAADTTAQLAQRPGP